MKQAKQPAMGGGWDWRWYVWLENGKRVVTWARTAEDARTKAELRRTTKVTKVEPAPSRLEEIKVLYE